jgi:hypothetical protein
MVWVQSTIAAAGPALNRPSHSHPWEAHSASHVGPCRGMAFGWCLVERAPSPVLSLRSRHQSNRALDLWSIEPAKSQIICLQPPGCMAHQVAGRRSLVFGDGAPGVAAGGAVSVGILPLGCRGDRATSRHAVRAHRATLEHWRLAACRLGPVCTSIAAFLATSLTVSSYPGRRRM